MGVLAGYFDSSGSDGHPFLVAGCVFTAAQAERVRNEWGKLFEPYGGCHWVDLVAGSGKFRKVSESERERLQLEASKILSRSFELALIQVSFLSEFRAIHEVKGSGLKSQYGVCCAGVAIGLAGRLIKANRPEHIAYAFEAGDRYHGEVDALFERIAKSDKATTFFRYHSHEFVKKDREVLLETADCIAWHARRFEARTLHKEHLPDHEPRMNPAFRGFWDRTRFQINHLDESKLEMIRKILGYIPPRQKKRKLRKPVT